MRIITEAESLESIIDRLNKVNTLVEELRLGRRLMLKILQLRGAGKDIDFSKIPLEIRRKIVESHSFRNALSKVTNPKGRRPMVDKVIQEIQTTLDISKL